MLGCSWGEPLERTSGKANWGFDKVFDLNVKGLFYLTRECIPMLERDAATEDPGRVINIGSVAGMIPQVGFARRLSPILPLQWNDANICLHCRFLVTNIMII